MDGDRFPLVGSTSLSVVAEVEEATDQQEEMVGEQVMVAVVWMETIVF